MKKLIGLTIAMLFAISLSVNAKPQKSKNLQKSQLQPAPVATYKPSPGEDPDGDGDAKGYSYFPYTRVATGKRVFIFDPNYAAWAIYDEQGKRINVGRASGGKYYCPDVGRGCKTIVGRYSVISKGGPKCVSSKFPLKTHGGAPMPYCMHFSSKGYAIHGSNDVPDGNASHGCIRVTPTVAKWLSENFVTIGTTVIVLPYEKRARMAVLYSDAAF